MSHRRLATYNSIALLLCVAANTYWQVFCRPTGWALTVLIACFATAAWSPLLLRRNRLVPYVLAVNGLAVVVFAYCAAFLNWLVLPALLLILLFGLGLLVFVPYYFIVQLCLSGLVHPPTATGRWCFAGGLGLGLAIFGLSAGLYGRALDDIAAFERSGYTELKQTFMTEKILGMGILYHVQFCEFDGWRPPLHEPLLNMGYWLHGSEDPLKVSLERRRTLYQEFFPGQPIKLACSCAIEESERYHTDGFFGG